MTSTKPQTDEHGLSLSDCPKFAGCSAPICPLDRSWGRRTLLKEDPTCFYLTEAVKNGAQARFEAAGLQHLYLAVTKPLPDIMDRYPRVRDALVRASLSGSRLDPVPRKASS